MIHEIPILNGPTLEAPITCKIYNSAYEVNTDPKKTTTIETIEAYTNRKSYLDVLNEKSKAASVGPFSIGISWIIPLYKTSSFLKSLVS